MPSVTVSQLPVGHSQTVDTCINTSRLRESARPTFFSFSDVGAFLALNASDVSTASKPFAFVSNGTSALECKSPHLLRDCQETMALAENYATCICIKFPSLFYFCV